MMKQALRYINEKSDKFWWIETFQNLFLVNWGKIGTTGRYELKEFHTQNECEKQASKLIAAKLKKGYTEMLNFDYMNHTYFDTEEFGLHLLTSHPNFRKYFAEDFYYDCANEEAPFGNDAGNDTLYELQTAFRKNSKLNFVDFPRYVIEDLWDMTYLPPQKEQTDEDLIEQAAHTFHDIPGEQELVQSSQVILAVTFGQIKITGKLDDQLQHVAFLTLERLEKIYRLLWNWKEIKKPQAIEIMQKDLIRFINHS